MASPQSSAVPQLCAKCGQPLGSTIYRIGGRSYHTTCAGSAMTSPADIEHRLRERLRDFDDEVAEHLANETERADLWTEIDVPVSYLREAADTIAQLRDSNARDFRIAVERACDERMTEQKHEIRRLEAEAAALREALDEWVRLDSIRGLNPAVRKKMKQHARDLTQRARTQQHGAKE
jgi:hypothetical protein